MAGAGQHRPRRSKKVIPMPESNGNGGRPSKLTPSVKKRLIDAISAGNYYEPACAYAGIHYATFRAWMVKGEEQKTGQYYEFYEEVNAAVAQAEVRIVAIWQQQIPEDWHAARDFLARRHPERWANKDVHRMTGKDDDSPIEVDIDPRDTLGAKLAAILVRAGQASVDSEPDD